MPYIIEFPNIVESYGDVIGGELRVESWGKGIIEN